MLGVNITLDPALWTAERWTLFSDSATQDELNSAAADLNNAAEHAINEANRMLMDESIEQIKAHHFALDEFTKQIATLQSMQIEHEGAEEIFIVLMEDYIHVRDTALDDRLASLQ